MKKDTHNQNLKQFQSDIHQIIEDWQKILLDTNLVDDSQYLSSISNHILTLDKHLELSAHTKYLKKEVDLLYSLLHNPWGAPFVSDVTLFEAAMMFSEQSPLKSHLRTLLKKIQFYHKRQEFPLLDALAIIEKEFIQKRKKAA